LADLRELCVFLLIRHGAHGLGGEALAGRSDAAQLSPLGSEQVHRIVQSIRHLPISAIYSSPVLRTRQTADVLAQALQLPIQTSEALSEVDFGDWAGHSLAELRDQTAWCGWNQFRSGTRAPGGELMLETQARIVAEMLRLRDCHRGEYVALVSHGDVIKSAVAYFLGVPLDLMLRIEISLASVSAVAIGDGGPWVLCVNNTSGVVLFPD
jgi:broad specificity phosphatase PhoE